MKIIFTSLILAFLAVPALSQQAEQRPVLKNEDFQRPPSSNVITNFNLTSTPKEGVITNEDIQRPTPDGVINNATISEGTHPVRPRRVAQPHPVIKDVKISSQRTQRKGAVLKGTAVKEDEIKDVKLSERKERVTESSLLVKKEKLEQRISDLRSELNELDTRVLENRPEDPNKIGDPYYVDPKVHDQVNLLKQELTDAEVEYQLLNEELEKY